MDEYWHRMKELRRSLKEDWEMLWLTKYEDENRAEGISSKDFDRLFVERGEVIHATRKFKPLSFRDILEKHLGSQDAAKIDIDPEVGGWGKFARTHFPAKSHQRERPMVKVDSSQHLRKGGAGWLNKARTRKKIRLNIEY